jgi:hypothetical protein
MEKGNFATDLGVVRIAVGALCAACARQETEMEKYTAEERAIFLRGYEDGKGQPNDFTSGETYKRARDQELYDSGVTFGQFIGSLRETMKAFDVTEDGALIYEGRR